MHRPVFFLVGGGYRVGARDRVLGGRGVVLGRFLVGGPDRVVFVRGRDRVVLDRGRDLVVDHYLILIMFTLEIP